jgi:hypothetical protein
MTIVLQPNPGYKLVGKPPMPARIICKKTGVLVDLHHGHYGALQKAVERLEHWCDNQAHVRPPPAAVMRYLAKTGYRLLPSDIASALYTASGQVRTPPMIVPKKPTKRGGSK